jgi:hypothetical protein
MISFLLSVQELPQSCRYTLLMKPAQNQLWSAYLMFFSFSAAAHRVSKVQKRRFYYEKAKKVMTVASQTEAAVCGI